MRSPVGQVWTYPLSSPSNQFQRFNDYARELDTIYAGLDASQRIPWQDLCELYPWECECIPGEFGSPLSDTADTGAAGHRNYNMARLAQGLPYSGSPPAVNTPPDGDRIDLALSLRPQPVAPPPAGYLMTLWRRRTPPDAVPYSTLVYVKGCNGLPCVQTALAKFRLAMVSDIVVGVPLDITPIFTTFPGLLGLNALVVRQIICVGGAAGFCAPVASIALV